MYTRDTATLMGTLSIRRAEVMGIPRRMVNNAASEKLRTAVVEMTVEARHKLNALSTDEVGIAADGEGNSVTKTIGNVDTPRKMRLGSLQTVKIIRLKVDKNGPTSWFFITIDLVMSQNMMAPMICVETIMPKTGKTGRFLVVHFS